MEIQLNSFNFRNFILIFIVILSIKLNGQTIQGIFSGQLNQPIKLKGYEGFDTYVIDSAVTDEKGSFELSYSKDDQGMGYLVSVDEKPFFVVLCGEPIQLKGTDLALPETIKLIAGKENNLFKQYTSEHARREQTLSAWDYLEKIYRLDTLFRSYEDSRQFIFKEKRRIQAEDSLFLASLPKNSYVSWYLPIRKLIGSASVIAQFRPDEIPTAISSFRAVDYMDERLSKSGMLNDLMESHFWLIENSGRSLDSVYLEMKISIDCMIQNLKSDEKKLNEIGNQLFKLLERSSLFAASEHLSLRLLNDSSCTLNQDLAARLESYRAMKKGNSAPEIEFRGDVLAPAYEAGKIPEKLSDVNSNYTVVIFGASWCPQCPVELSQMIRKYPAWKAHNVEVVFVSLDDSKQAFKSFASVFPFISICDYKKWESPNVKKYHVFATPTIYLLDHKQEILLRPHSVSQLDSWIDWYLLKRNK